MKIIDLYVVVDNKDPYNASRVRAYPLSLFDRTTATASQILSKKDENANYTPWEKAETFNTINDPYCFEPFLPKHINIIPSEGDLIKVISYEDQVNSPKEYLIVNSSINNIGNEKYRNADRFHPNNTKRGDKDLVRTTTPGYNPSYSDIGITSGKNSDVVLNNGRIVLRAGHQKLSDTGVKQVNQHLATINLSQFNSGYTYTDVETTTTEQTRTSITTIIEYQILDYVNNPITINGAEYRFGCDIRTKTSNVAQYIDTISNAVITTPDVQMIMYFDDSKKFVNTFKKLITQFEKRQLNYLFNESNFSTDKSNDFIYKIIDNRTPIGGVMPDNALNFGKYFYIRQSRNQEFLSLEGTTLISNITASISITGGDIRPKPAGVKTIKSKTIKRNLIETGYPETIITSGADYQYLLSWKNNDYPKLNTREFITQEMIYSKGGLLDTTEPMVRGNQLLIVISKFIDLILDHGHKDNSDSRGTIDNVTIENLNRIKSTILNIKNIEKQLKTDSNDINDAINNLTNHNLRIN